MQLEFDSKRLDSKWGSNLSLPYSHVEQLDYKNFHNFCMMLSYCDLIVIALVVV